MVKRPVDITKIEFHPLTADRWADFEYLFGPNGACAGCWCMWYRMSHKEYKESGKEGHKNAIRTLVQSDAEPGLLSYADGKPVGWVTIAPREEYIRLKTSRILAPVDDLSVWSIPCFFIHKDYRGIGLLEKLIKAAVDYAQTKGAKIVEAYPYETEKRMSALSIFSGIASTFRRTGFDEVERRSEKRPIMRLTLE